jgi:hypothetical protein
MIMNHHDSLILSSGGTRFRRTTGPFKQKNSRAQKLAVRASEEESRGK